MRRAEGVNGHSSVPTIVERLRGQPPADQAELTQLIGLLQHDSEAEVSRS